MPRLISDTHSGVCWLLWPPSHVLIYFVLLLSAQVDKGLGESFSLSRGSSRPFIIEPAGRRSDHEWNGMLTT